ncbi:MAG: hypothetical protein GQ574_02830 [Crocinitomix sp.]|nr:hypothetical protein [Crocinitomix sp.]
MAKKEITVFKRIIYGLWIAVVLAIIGILIVNPLFFSVENLVNFIRRFETQLMVVYILISSLRGLFLIPSTPFVLAGVILFPFNPIFVICVSMGGILLTTIMLYYFSDLLGFSKTLEKKFPHKMKTWEDRLRSKHAIWIVLAWSFFPLVPTDLICYIAGIVKMPLKYLLLGVGVGELILVTCYVYLGSGIIDWVMS